MEETAAILDSVRQRLTFQPEERPSIDEILKSEWMLEWVWPDYEKKFTHIAIFPRANR